MNYIVYSKQIVVGIIKAGVYSFYLLQADNDTLRLVPIDNRDLSYSVEGTSIRELLWKLINTEHAESFYAASDFSFTLNR